MASVEDLSSSSEDESAETTLNDDLPRGSERNVIEYYFYRGLTYRHITLMLEKQHNIIMNERTLKRRLKDYRLKRRETVDEELKERSRNASGILLHKKYALVLIASVATELCEVYEGGESAHCSLNSIFGGS